MAFTYATITHSFLNPDGSAASGAVKFRLTQRMTNGSVSIMPGQSVTAAINGTTGAISQSLAANNDPDTVPQDVQWEVTIEQTGADVVSYYITVPTGGGSVDLGTLLPSQQQAG